jgi:hypothetical protein
MYEKVCKQRKLVICNALRKLPELTVARSKDLESGSRLLEA